MVIAGTTCVGAHFSKCRTMAVVENTVVSVGFVGGVIIIIFFAVVVVKRTFVFGGIF